MSSPDDAEVLIISGDNGVLYSLNISKTEENILERLTKAADNPHHMPLIQLLVADNS